MTAMFALMLVLAAGPTGGPATGELTGYVLDQTGNPLAGMKIEASLQAWKSVSKVAYTNAEGAFRLPGLAPGKYTVVASAPKLRPVIQKDVAVEARKPTELTIVVEVATTTEEITVREVPALRLTGANVQESYDLELRGSPPPAFNTETYGRHPENPFLASREHPVSTFSIDVDTASYANTRRFIDGGSLPPADAVRVEELINYFPFDYPAPSGDDPLAIGFEVNDCPWNPEGRLVRIGLRAKSVPIAQRPASNLVFLVDVSGSMADANKLPLVKRSLQLLVESLQPRDRVAMVVYAGASGLVLDSTPASERPRILAAIEALEAGGSTNGGAGIQLAYDVARRNFLRGGNNRVLLATDGDFNVGVTRPDDLVRMIEAQAKTGVFLTVLGYGMGNLKDATMEGLADRGNGNYAYVDTLNEARKVLQEQLSGTLLTVAQDVKLQVVMNPDKVAVYRLIGYENRLLAKADFDDDRKDAGELGADHTVTALYEVVPTSRGRNRNGPLLTVKARFKPPGGWFSRKRAWAVTDVGVGLSAASGDFRFAAAVAAFGMILRRSPHRGTADFDQVLGLAEGGLGRDGGGHRRGFLDLVRKAQVIAAGASNDLGLQLAR